jgi:hypothetical protein
MASFELAQQFRDKNGGALRYDMRQMFPQTSAISGQRPGVTAPATGITTFQWTDDSQHWVPALSYFNVRGHFLDGVDGDALARPPVGRIGAADNWVACLFSQIQIFCNSQSIELLQNSPQADTAALYSSVDRTWLKSFGSASGVGEGLQTRILNSAQFGTAAVGATNYNELVATWRPALSVMDCPSALPPGPQWRVDFTWSSTAEQNLVESIAVATAGTHFVFVLDELTFFKCTIVPDLSVVDLPVRGLIELNPVQVNTYPLTGGTTLQVNVPMPATCERLLICFQDNNSANALAAGQNGQKPLTSFAAGFSSGATDLASYIQQLYVSFPELGYQAPNPTYNLTALNAAGAKSGWERAYQDWIAICKGASGGYEGSISFGTADEGIGAAILAPNDTGAPVLTMGNPADNDQQIWLADGTAGATGLLATTGARTAKYGWLGRCPGPIFAFPVIRPSDKIVTSCNVNLQLSAAATSINMFVIMSYSMALAVEREASGRYHYEVVRGV